MKYILLFLTLNLFAQSSDLVTTQGIKTALHQNNIGKIYFTSRKVEADAVKPSDFLKSYKLTNKSDLFFIAYFDKSLTNCKHQLDASIPVDSLFMMGNYQFTLFVDNKEIYSSNLLPGAPQKSKQDTDTFLNRPFIDNLNGQGSWSESFWNRFLSNGGEKALTDGTHLLQMEIRPYIKKDNAIVTGKLMATGELEILVDLHPKINISNIKLNKSLPYDGFPLSKESFDTGKIKELKSAVEEGVFKKINSIIVIKNGELLIEEYFNGEDRHTLHDPRSVGKSFASTLLGKAIDDGYIKNEMQPLGAFYPLHSFEHFTADKEEATLYDLLTMSSGFEGNDEDGSSPGNEENMYPTDNWVKFALDLPFQKSLRERWHYFTAGVILLGDVINKSVPGGLQHYADENLFKPLKIRNYKWQYTPQQVPNTAGGIQMNALDFAKYGQLYKNGGIWQGKQIISQEWIAKSFTKQKQIVGRDDEYYGYLFWNKKFRSNTKQHEAYYCAGNGGNYILVFKEQPLVIVITASAYGQPYAHTQVTKILSDYILPAVTK